MPVEAWFLEVAILHQGTRAVKVSETAEEDQDRMKKVQ